MKPVSLEKFLDQLDQELAWREKEIGILKKNIEISDSETYLRSGIVLLYAHWEGFIKSAAELYLKFVASKRLRLNELQDCFIALALKKESRELGKTGKTGFYIKTVDFMLNRLSEQAIIPYEISTQWNLKSKPFKEILISVGLPCTPYETKMNIIDVLVDTRNDIAHGKQKPVDKSRVENIFTVTIEILKDIQTDIFDAAEQKSYKRRAI